MDEIASSGVTGIWRNQNNMTVNMNRKFVESYINLKKQDSKLF